MRVFVDGGTLPSWVRIVLSLCCATIRETPGKGERKTSAPLSPTVVGHGGIGSRRHRKQTAGGEALQDLLLISSAFPRRGWRLA